MIKVTDDLWLDPSRIVGVKLGYCYKVLDTTLYELQVLVSLEGGRIEIIHCRTEDPEEAIERIAKAKEMKGGS